MVGDDYMDVFWGITHLVFCVALGLCVLFFANSLLKPDCYDKKYAIIMIILDTTLAELNMIWALRDFMLI